MSPEVVTPTVEETLGILADRIRHLETEDKWQFGMMRNADHFAVGSVTGGVAEAITNLGGSEGVVYLPPKAYPFNANYTVPANVHLIFGKGAVFNIAHGIMVTIDGTLEAGLYQIFDLTGTGITNFAPNTVALFFPQWWGAVADGITTDTEAIQAAIFTAESAGGGWVFFPPTATSYYISDVGYTPKYGLQLREGVSLLGVGLNSALKIEDVDMPGIISPTGGGVWQHQSIKGLRIYFDKPGGAWWTSRSNQKVIRFTQNVNSYTLERLLLEKGYAGVWDETSSFSNKYSHITTDQCRYGFFKVDLGGSPSAGTMNVWERCWANGAAAAQGILPIPANWDIRGYHIRSGWAYKFEACTLQGYHVTIPGVEDGPPPVCAAYFRDIKSLSIDATNIEDMDVTEGSVILVHTCGGFSIDGIMHDGGTDLRTGVGGVAQLLFIEENSTGVIDGVHLVGGTSYGTGTAHTLRVAGNAQVVVNGGTIWGIVGAANVYAISKTGAGGGLVLHGVLYDTLNDPNNQVSFLQPGHATQEALLVPRLTTAERNALTAINGMIIYNTNNLRLEGYENGVWVDL